MKLNKNGKVNVLVIENDFEGDQNTVYAIDDHERLAADMEHNWELGEKKTVFVNEMTKEEYLETVRLGMEWGGHDEAEQMAAVASVKFEPYSEVTP